MANEVKVTIIALLLIVATAFLGYLAGFDEGTANGVGRMQIRAVEVGAAEWVVHEDGEVFFRWKETPNP